MSGYKTFAVAGAGNIGKFIVEELVKSHAKVKVLTRSESGNTDLLSLGVELTIVDYTSHSSLVSALKGIDVVICALGVFASNFQQPLAIAAKEAGAKLFVPSDFGGSTEGATEGIFGVKEGVRMKLIEIGLPYAVFYSGPFPDFVFIPFLGFDFADGKATVGGDGNTLISFTTRRDVARFVAHVLTALAASEFENKIFRIEGERTSFNAIFKEYTSRTGTPISTTYLTPAELEERIKANPADYSNLLHLAWATGNGVVGEEEELANGVWKEWEPKKAVDGILGA